MRGIIMVGIGFALLFSALETKAEDTAKDSVVKEPAAAGEDEVVSQDGRMARGDEKKTQEEERLKEMQRELDRLHEETWSEKMQH
jgi:hypothetical protein